MSTFSIIQPRATTDLYLIPSANGCNIDLIPVGDTDNWKCVDDTIDTPDEDATYVYGASAATDYDLYLLPNHTTESGIINYVQIYSRAKSHEFAQHEDGVYKIILTDNACGNIYKSNDIDLTTGTYKTYDGVWTVNPRTSVAWTWADIDNLQIGLECDSPEVSGAPNILTIRPNAPGDVTQLTPVGDATNWECVDDITRDNLTTHVEVLKDEGYRYDLYNLTNHTTEVGVISKIVVYAWVYISDTQDGDADTVIKIGGNTYYAAKVPNNNEWVLSSTEYALNPASSLAWTWADIDNLQAGYKLNPPIAESGYNTCTQVYVAVYYVEDISPEIRTTQCYAKINYVPSDAECTLNKPEEISVDHSRNIKMLNFWDGTREVYDLSRNSKGIVLTGSEYHLNACERIACIRAMGKDGSTITIAGLRNLFNGEYKIRSFGWKHVSKKPEYYNWILELEDNN